jgi:hypothetical protein
MSTAATIQHDAHNLPGPARAKGARATKPTRKAKSQGASRPRKVSFYLSDVAVQRLGVAASMEFTDKSRVVERLVIENLKRYVISDRVKADDQATGEVSTD